MTKAPYYQGDSVRLSFQVKDKNEIVIPFAVDFIVVDDVDNICYEGQAAIYDDTVVAVVPEVGTKQPGKYTIIYTVHLPSGDTRSHRQTYRILPKGPVVGEGFDKSVNISPDSDYGEVALSKGNAMRALRQLGKTAKEAAEAIEALVEKKTGRRTL